MTYGFKQKAQLVLRRKGGAKGLNEAHQGGRKCIQLRVGMLA